MQPSSIEQYKRLQLDIIQALQQRMMVEVYGTSMCQEMQYKQKHGFLIQPRLKNLAISSHFVDKSSELLSESRSELEDHQYKFQKSSKLSSFNCFISQAPVLVKTLDLVGFTLRLGRDTSADHRPGNRNFQDGQQFPLSCQDGHILEWEQKPVPEDDSETPSHYEKTQKTQKDQEMLYGDATHHQTDRQIGGICPVSAQRL